MIGSGAVYERNLPAAGSYVIDPVEFAKQTTRYRKSYPSIAWPGFGERIVQSIDRYGIIGKLDVYLQATLTGDGTAAPTATMGYPWRFVKEFRVSANGISNLIEMDGIDARALARVRAHRALTDESTFTLPSTSGTSTLRLHWEIPLALDEVSLVGAVLAQTQDNSLSLEIRTDDSSDLFSADAPTVSSAAFYVVATAYEIPESNTRSGRQLIIPDLQQMHGIFTRDDDLTGTGEKVQALTKTGGLLLRTLQRVDNAAPSYGVADWLDDSVTEHKFRFNSKEVPLDYLPAWALRFQNERDYGGKLLPAADVVSGGTAPAYVCDDFINRVPSRDVVNMAAISQPELLNTFPSSYTINSGAQVHTVQEAMVTG